MKSKQALSIEQMQHLQELGLDTSNASMYWISYNGISVYIPSNFHLPTSNNDYVICDAYTLQDVLDTLPSTVLHDKQIYELDINMCNETMEYVRTSVNDVLVGLRFTQLPLIDSAYSLLCWAIENKFVETDKNE